VARVLALGLAWAMLLGGIGLIFLGVAIHHFDQLWR
jgi:hypothetical protein